MDIESVARYLDSVAKMKTLKWLHYVQGNRILVYDKKEKEVGSFDSTKDLQNFLYGYFAGRDDAIKEG